MVQSRVSSMMILQLSKWAFTQGNRTNIKRRTQGPYLALAAAGIAHPAPLAVAAPAATVAPTVLAAQNGVWDKDYDDNAIGLVHRC